MKSKAVMVAAILICIAAKDVRGQLFKPGNKHFSVQLQGGVVYNSENRKDWIDNGAGYYAGVGVSRFFLGFLHTGIGLGYEWQERDMQLASETWNRLSYSTYSAGIESTPFFQLLHVKLAEKSKHFECRHLTFYLTPTIGYNFRFAGTGVNIATHAFYWGGGITTSFNKSGRQKLPMHLLLNAGIRRYFSSNFSAFGSKFYGTLFGVDLICVFYRSGSFFGNS